ncbi:MAG: RecX family transcriptional regulator [Ignavibacteriae bacterium]|nr:RecX family transcriptional regulator [Ignavibacteriota bacterium]MCB9244007.1 RecX family transcriptional regulator [Ignavibacteriales bacterium]
MKITGIEQQRKDKNRYNFYVDGEYMFALYDDTILKYGLRRGDMLEARQIKEMKDYDSYNYAKKVAYNYLSYRQRSRREISRKLKTKKIPDRTIDKVIKWLEELKYINDEEFAKQLIENKVARKPIGRKMVEKKLFQSGIDKETIVKTITENYSPEMELQKAEELLKKYVKKVKYKDEFDKRNKCFKYLASRGFEYDTVEQIINMHCK